MSAHHSVPFFPSAVQMVSTPCSFTIFPCPDVSLPLQSSDGIYPLLSHFLPTHWHFLQGCLFLMSQCIPCSVASRGECPSLSHTLSLCLQAPSCQFPLQGCILSDPMSACSPFPSCASTPSQALPCGGLLAPAPPALPHAPDSNALGAATVALSALPPDPTPAVSLAMASAVPTTSGTPSQRPRV